MLLSQEATPGSFADALSYLPTDSDEKKVDANKNETEWIR